MRAHVVQRVDAQAEDFSVAVERELRGHDLVAPVGIAEERFGARRRPSDRAAAAAARGPQHQRVLGIAAALHAEAAADVG